MWLWQWAIAFKDSVLVFVLLGLLVCFLFIVNIKILFKVIIEFIVWICLTVWGKIVIAFSALSFGLFGNTTPEFSSNFDYASKFTINKTIIHSSDELIKKKKGIIKLRQVYWKCLIPVIHSACLAMCFLEGMRERCVDWFIF